MDVLIIALDKRQFDDTVVTYPEHLRRQNKFHHITYKEQMQGYHMPVQIRFVGNYWELPDAPTLEYYAQHIVAEPKV